MKTQNVVEDLKLFEVKGQKEKKKGVLENVDTTGLSRNQKKKLKKKLAKQVTNQPTTKDDA